ncbi:MAG: PHP domain-containing protein [Clostridia bacterium]|nr:PHP domain-containing protein [Clostridia bacterium]
MALFGDYHTHSVYSRRKHGKGTIEENVQSAVKKGLRQIAITDHGFNQTTFGVKREQISLMKAEIEEIKDRYPIEILLGVEANIISAQGDIDIVDSDYKDLDVVICGYHKIVKTPRFRDKLNFVFKNVICSFFKWTSKKQRERNTNAYISAMKKYDIDILSHLNHGCKVDIQKVAKVARETGTLIELNGKRLGMTDKEILIAYKEGAKFIINSDAHSPKRVGECHKGLKAALRLRLPDSCIVNYNDLPKFKKESKKRRVHD